MYNIASHHAFSKKISSVFEKSKLHSYSVFKTTSIVCATYTENPVIIIDINGNNQ